MPRGRTPLDPDATEKGVIFRGQAYDQLHELRVRTGAKSYKDAALLAIRTLNANLAHEQGQGAIDEQLHPFLSHMMSVTERLDHDPLRDFLGTLDELFYHVGNDRDQGKARLGKAYQDGVNAALHYHAPQQARLEAHDA